MASVQKLTITRWIDPRTKARVTAGTPGAKRVRVKTENYYVVNKEGGRVERINTDCTTREAADAFLTAWRKERERGNTGLADPYKPHLDRPIREHLTEYIAVVRVRTSTAEYPKAVEREIGRVFDGCKMVVLRDLTAERVGQYLHVWAVAPVTRNKTRTYLFSFCDWLVDGERLPRNPIDRVPTATQKQDDAREPRRRRAMRVKELRSLLAAVERFPLWAANTNKGGRPRADGTPARPRNAVELTPETVAKLTRQGRERRLVYRTALLTGLRGGELRRTRVKFLKPRNGGYALELPAHLTKNRRRAVIPLTALHADDLRQWVADTGRGPDDLLFDLPDARSLSRIHRRQLRLAGITYRTEHGYADYHSLRKSLNTFLRRKGVSLRVRQRVLRHAAADLATNTYDDERLAELRPVLKLLARLDHRLAATQPAPAPAG